MATIKQTMSTEIQRDPNNRPSVVNEANNGLKAVPVEFVIKADDDSTFTQVNEGNPLPVKGDLQLTGSKVGLATDPMPAGTEGDTYMQYDVATEETKVFKFIGGDWREL